LAFKPFKPKNLFFFFFSATGFAAPFPCHTVEDSSEQDKVPPPLVSPPRTIAVFEQSKPDAGRTNAGSRLF